MFSLSLRSSRRSSSILTFARPPAFFPKTLVKDPPIIIVVQVVALSDVQDMVRTSPGDSSVEL